ncbi:hypothetical protein [Geminisphaera colitermitum]|uniref:hypothetical protein n=1 Tax=Geminisphaera colitermitum TaxID=1148786 RepID=UPI0001964ED0|nr:hypothetical protein [Geminisphaera colitermitum]
MALTLPNEVRAGQQVRAETVNQLIRYAKSITPRDSATIRWETKSGGATPEVIERPRRGAAAATVTLAPLTLTTTPPVGWVAPESDQTDPDNVPYRFWLTFGTVDYTAPERADGQHAFTTPVVEIPRNVAQTMTQRVYLECEWPGPTNQYALWTHIWLKTQPSTDTFPSPAPIGANGWRPKFYLLLGNCSVAVSGTGSTQTKTPLASNADQGSFRSFIQGNAGGYVQFTAADLPEHPPTVTMVREVVFFRNQRPTA